MSEALSDFTQALGAAQVLLAESTAERERNDERAEKMARVAGILRRDLEHAIGAEAVDPAALLLDFAQDLDDEARVTFLVEVYFLDAFTPYSIRYLNTQRRRGYREVAAAIDMDERTVRRIGQAVNSAKASHRKRNWGRAGLIGVGAAVVLGLGGFVAAPLVGGALGAGAGLAGAAATAHGLALLGGGALAAGGAGVAGGMWLVAGAGAVVGAAAGGGGAVLFQLGAAQARGELLKLQVTFKVSVLGSQADQARAQNIIATLAEQTSELRGNLELERELNEENSQRIKDLEETIEAIEETVAWMEDQVEAA